MMMSSLEKDLVLPAEHLLQEESVKASPASPPPPVQSEQPRLAGPRPLRPKNGLQHPRGQAPPTGLSQRIGKRRYSMSAGFKGLAKRRRRVNSDSQSEPVLPSTFLLGGNIFDPLNLNSLLDEDVNRLNNQETPQCSPLPSRGGGPVEILVPRDITDPLNLRGGEHATPRLLSPPRPRRRHRHRPHGGGEESKTARVVCPATQTGGSVSPLPCELNTAITCRDDLAPPPRRHTHPPPGNAHKQGDGRQRRRRHSMSVRSGANVPAAQPISFQTPLVGRDKANRTGGLQQASVHTLEKKKKDKWRYQYGNHDRYYGYMGFYGDRREGRVGATEDPRLRLLNPDWFRDKRVLDIGCGAGHVTLAIARQFSPAHILGVDRDARLVHAARQNVRHFLSHDLVCGERVRRGDALHLLSSPPPVPLSLRVSRGALAAPPLLAHLSSSAPTFPSNACFITGDYLSGQDTWPGRGEYDIIVCLGVAKWIHLQSGDEGVARLFRRAYQSLSPGGMFILETHPWSSYTHSKRASATTFRNYRSLRLRPDDFTHVLMKTGFSSYRLLTPHTGVPRPVYVFHKGSAPRK